MANWYACCTMKNIVLPIATHQAEITSSGYQAPGLLCFWKPLQGADDLDTSGVVT